MKKKYQTELLGALHETAVGLHEIGAISDKEMREYDKDCLASHPKTTSDALSIPNHKPVPAYADSRKS
jgi:DNA-binding transcriptional regulator YiaG